MRDFKLKWMKAVATFATAFTNEGYVFILEYTCTSLMMYKLKHRVNGAVIIITADPKKNEVTMKRNGIIKVRKLIIGDGTNSLCKP